MAANQSSSDDINSITTSFQTQPIRKFSIKLKNTIKSLRNTEKSFVWDYFGDLLYDNVACDRNRNYCSPCLEKAREDVTRPNAMFHSFKITKYQTNASTSNYAWHLCRHHGITESDSPRPPKPMKAERKRTYRKRLAEADATETDTAAANIGLLSGSGDDGDANTVAVEKGVPTEELTNAIAVWFSRDMVSLANVNGAGFKDFLQRFDIVNDPTSVATSAQLKVDLIDIYTVLIGHVRYALTKSAPSSGCLTITKWSDVVGRYSYTSFTYHFVTEDFAFSHICLRVVSSISPLSADNLAQEMQRSVHHFGLDKKLFVTRDTNDAVIETACQQIGVQSFVCIGHILDALVVADGINAIKELRDLLVKSHLIVNTLNLGAESLMTAIPDQFYHEALLEMGQLEDIFTAEGLLDQTKPPNDTQTSTRWHVNLKLLQTLIKHKTIINVLLEQLQNIGDVALDENEWQALEGLEDFLSAFADAVDILSNCYPTLNLVLLFRSHLLLQLEETKDDHPYVVHLKALIKTTFDAHFPLDSDAVLAALLDPRLRDLTVVNEYLTAVKKDKAQFLSEAVWKHEIVIENSVTSTGASETIVQLVACEDTNAKRPRLSITQLAKQHSGATAEKSDAIGDEIKSLLTQPSETVVNDDILSFWNRKQNDWPVLSALARTVFCIPATSAPVSTLFQHEGMLRASRFCSLNPAIVDKVVFVGENYQHFSKETNA